MGNFKYSAGLWALGGAYDRFCTAGYAEKEQKPLKRLWRLPGASMELMGQR